MLEEIREIGEKILGSDSERLLDNLILDVKPLIKGRKRYLVIIDYKIFDKTIGIDFEEIRDETPQQYLWVGNADASNSPQIYFTTNKITFLLSQTIPNLIQKCQEKSGLKKFLLLTLKEIFYDLGFSGRYKYILDGEKINLFKKGYIREFIDECRQKGEEEKDTIEDLLKELESKVGDFIKSKTRLTKKDIGLYTLKINGRLMIDEEEYRQIVIREKIESLFEDRNKKTCSCCNKEEFVTDSPKFAKAGSALGYYITDKVGFSSELSGEFYKNFSICKDCYKKLLVGEVFVKNNLKSFLAGSNLYIIPKFIFPITINQERLLKWAEYIESTFNSVKSIDGLREFQKNLEEYKDFEDTKNNFILNLLFWRKGTGAETKVLRLIKDVPPTRLDTLRQTTSKIKDIGDSVLGVSNQWIIDLQNIYYLIPLRKKQNEIEYRKILSLYDAIFSAKPVSYSFLINQFIELAQVYRFKRTKYNVTVIAEREKWKKEDKWNRELMYAVLKANLLLLYLRKLNLLKGGDGMDYDSLQLDEGIKAFLKEVKYDGPRVSMFLLGYLIGEIGNAQYRLSESHTKPILNKINFEGMNPNKLIRLTNEVFEKLNQYKVFSEKEKSRVPLLVFNQGIFNEYKRLIDKEIANWELSDHENVFYLLSGYAYASYQPLKVSLEKEEVKENE